MSSETVRQCGKSMNKPFNPAGTGGAPRTQKSPALNRAGRRDSGKRLISAPIAAGDGGGSVLRRARDDSEIGRSELAILLSDAGLNLDSQIKRA